MNRTHTHDLDTFFATASIAPPVSEVCVGPMEFASLTVPGHLFELAIKMSVQPKSWLAVKESIHDRDTYQTWLISLCDQDRLTYAKEFEKAYFTAKKNTDVSCQKKCMEHPNQRKPECRGGGHSRLEVTLCHRYMTHFELGRCMTLPTYMSIVQWYIQHPLVTGNKSNPTSIEGGVAVISSLMYKLCFNKEIPGHTHTHTHNV